MRITARLRRFVWRCGLIGVGLVASMSPLNAQDPKAAEASRKEASLADELPRIPPVEPTDALATFQVQKGFRLELVAAEPDVSDPVDACFDEFGRMFVAEMHGYPFSHEPTKLNPKGGGKPNDGIVRLLEDTDGDGRVDRSTKFADGITWPTSVCCWNGGVLVLAPPTLWFLKDTDGDRVADVKQNVFSGFNRDNVQALANNLKWGLDHRVYAAGATNPSQLSDGEKTLLSLGRVDFSFDPNLRDLRPETGGVQFGHSFDDWGHRFVCSNSNHIQEVIFNYRYLSRNPSYVVGGAIRSIAKEGAASPVFRRSPPEPWRIVRTRRRVADPKFAGLAPTERVPIGFFTSATGVTIYRGAAWPEEFRGQAIIGDVGGNLIHRKILDPAGVAFSARRADENVEFIASTDNWFRPVNFVNAPDGTLYVLDMYRETIEHPASIPDDIKEHLDLYSGDNRGRVYRIVSPDGRRLKVEPLGQLPTAQLVASLDSPNAWTRDTAHRLLWERQDQNAVEPLRTLLKSSTQSLGRLHALYSLQGLKALMPDDVLKGLADKSPRVREHAALLSEPFLNREPRVLDGLLALTGDTDAGVLFQTALSLGEASDPRIADGLSALLKRASDVPELVPAVMTAAGSVADRVLISLLKEAGSGKAAINSTVLSELARMVASRSGPKSTAAVLAFLVTGEEKSLPLTVRSAALLAFVDGLQRGGSSLSAMLKTSEGMPLQVPVDEFLGLALTRAQDASQTDSIRAASVRLLALNSEAKTLPVLRELLTPATPQSVQTAAVQTAARFSSAQVTEILLANWKSFSPQLRNDVLDVLLGRVDRAAALLSAIETEAVRSGELGPERRTLLMNHPTKEIQERAAKLLGREVNSDRAAVVKNFQSVLDKTGDATRGRMLFMQKCSVCHKLGQEGHMVGPDIVSVQNKSPSDLLIAILDPNREAQPAFIGYSAILKDGRVINGLIVGESGNALTLRRAEGKEDVVSRGDLDELLSTGRTLMPDGLEKDITADQFADIIAFIKSLGTQTTPAPTGK